MEHKQRMENLSMSLAELSLILLIVWAFKLHMNMFTSTRGKTFTTHDNSAADGEGGGGVGEADAVKMNIGETDILPIMHRFQVLRHEIVGGKAFHTHVAVPFSGLKRLLVLLGARMPHSIRHRTDEPHGTRHLDGHEEIDSQLEHRHWVRRRVGFERVLKLEIRLLVHKTTVAYCTPIPTDGDGMIPRVERVRHQEYLQRVHVEDVPPPVRKGDGIVVGHVKGYGLANVFPYDGKPWRRVDDPHQKKKIILCAFFGTENTHTSRNTHTHTNAKARRSRARRERSVPMGRTLESIHWSHHEDRVQVEASG